MNKELARTVFKSWQGYVETADRFEKLMMKPPLSFLPYPIEVLEEALNIIAKERFDAGDRKTASSIQTTMSTYLFGYYLGKSSEGELTATDRPMTDEEALEGMRRMLDMILGDPPLKKTVLENLRASQRSWMEMRGKQ